MNKILLLLLLVGFSAKAQTSVFFTTSGQDKSQFTKLDSLLGATGSTQYFTELSRHTNLGDMSHPQPITEDIQKHTWFNDLTNTSNSSLISLTGLPSSISTVTLAEVSKISKPVVLDYSDYVLLPTKISKFLEFHTNETTLDGKVVASNTTYLTSHYDSNVPASTGNGATVIQSGIYNQSFTGSGNTPWFTATAPTNLVGTSIDLYTASNLVPQNNTGAFNINTANGNTLQLATTVDGGYIGWSDPNKSTKLVVGAGMIDITGNLTVENLITSKLGVTVSSTNLAATNISYNSVTFSNLSGVQGLIGNTANFKGFASQEDAFLIFSKYRDGIVINSSSTIAFITNSNPVGKFIDTGFLIGDGDLDPSAIFGVNSRTQGVLLPRSTTNEIMNISNPAEGDLFYNLDYHTLVFFNGESWRKVKTKKLKRTKFM